MMQELNYIRCGDYYIPDIRLPEETRPIGRWGRDRAYEATRSDGMGWSHEQHPQPSMTHPLAKNTKKCWS